MANVSDKLAMVACPLGIIYLMLGITAAQQTTAAPSTVLYNKGIVVSLFPYPYPGHVELFEGVDPKEMTSATASTQHPFLQENILITTLVPDPASNRMFYIDVYTNSIYRWDNVTTTLNDQTVSTINQTYKLYEGLSRAICKLDYDYVSGNLYWSDPLLHWIAILPADSDNTDGKKILLSDDVDYVAAMVLDSESKYLFWVSSAYEDGKMERSNLFGEDRQVIIPSSFGFVDDMALDMTEKKLYWVDSYRMTVESADYNGNGRRVIRRLVGTEFTSIAVIESNICLINFDNYEMQCMYKTSGDRYAYHSFYPSNPYSVGFFNPGVQKTGLQNNCATKACDHICVNTNTPQPRCMCKDGYTLQPNGISCIQTNPLFDSGVVITNSTHICMIELSALSSIAKNKPLRCEGTTATKDTHHIQVHVAKNLLYYTAKSADTTTGNKTQLMRFELSSKSHWVVVQDMEDPDDIAFDWVGEKMYSCHSKLNQIKSWDVVTGLSSVIYSDRFTAKVSELAIDPHRANLFWISYEMDNPSIYLGSFTGVAPIKLVSSASLSKPMGISFEYLDDSACYIDGGRFYGVSLNGTLANHRVSVGDATKSLIYKNYVIWDSGPSTLKMSLYTIDSSIFTTTTTMGTINAMALYSKEAQTEFLNPCKIGNGGCDDLCFRKGKEVSCMCDFGRTLDPANNRSCKAVPMTTNFMLVTDLSHDRIVQISMDGQRVVSLPINNLMTPAMARYSHHDNMLYWTEVGSKSIRRGSLDGTVNQKLLGVGGEAYADRFVIDFTTGQLFYTVSHSKQQDNSYIAVMKPKLAQNETKQLITKLHYPGGIAIDPKKGYIYYNSHGVQVYIARADTDGTNIQTIVNFTQSGGTPLGMTIDYQNNVLYWADAFTDQDKIEYIDLNTNARSLLRKDMTSDVVDLLVSGGFLYYVGYNRHKITKVNINTKQLADFMADQPEFGAIDSVDIVPTANTQPVNTQCSQGNGGCSHYCFSKPSGKVCGCPDNLYLDQTTQLTCTSAPPTCPMTIPNGQLNPGCTARSGTSCGYSCISDRFMKNTNVNILTCTPSMFWDHPTDTLCIEKVCDTTMHAGTLLNCQGKAGEMCGWTCPANLQKKPYLEQVVCLNSGQWSTPLDQLCIPKVKCNSAITNGFLQSCSYDAGDSCSVKCNTNFKPAYDRIYCLPDGAWDQNVQTICKPIIVTKCPSTINMGFLESCNYETDKSCRVRCNSGYSPVVDYIHCLPDGIWDKDTNTLCDVTKVVTPEKQTAAASSATTGLTAAVVIVVILLVIVIALGVTFYVCRRRIFTATDKQSVQGRYRTSPNVYFNASDSRGEVPAQGFINPALHATNGDAMPNTDPLKMDQINLSDDPNKENRRNEGHYDVIKEGKAAAAGGAGAHEAVNPLYSTMQPSEEIKFPNAEEVKEKPGYQRFS